MRMSELLQRRTSYQTVNWHMKSNMSFSWKSHGNLMSHHFQCLSTAIDRISWELGDILTRYLMRFLRDCYGAWDETYLCESVRLRPKLSRPDEFFPFHSWHVHKLRWVLRSWPEKRRWGSWAVAHTSYWMFMDEVNSWAWQRLCLATNRIYTEVCDMRFIRYLTFSEGFLQRLVTASWGIHPRFTYFFVCETDL